MNTDTIINNSYVVHMKLGVCESPKDMPDIPEIEVEKITYSVQVRVASPDMGEAQYDARDIAQEFLSQTHPAALQLGGWSAFDISIRGVERIA